jgi:hypothetical protein
MSSVGVQGSVPDFLTKDFRTSDDLGLWTQDFGLSG